MKTNRSVGTLILFGMMASAAFAEGTRPPRQLRLEAGTPIAATLMVGAAGPGGWARAAAHYRY